MRGSRDEKLKEKGWSVLLRLIFFKGDSLVKCNIML